MSAAAGLARAEEELRGVAGDRSFERGLGYVKAVTGLEQAGDKVLATVRGSRDYLVLLTLPGGRIARPGLRGECGCPYGQEGFFCKHCVAVGLAVARAGVKVRRPRPEVGVSGRGGSGTGRSGSRGAGSGGTGRSGSRGAGSGGVGTGPGADIASWLGSQSREELLALIGQRLLEDEDWQHRLGLRAAAAACDLGAVRERVADLLAPGDQPAGGGEYYGYLEGSQARRYACRIAEVSEAVAALAGEGHADAAAIVAEDAVQAVAAAARNAKDPAGSIAAAAAALAGRHRQACLTGQAEPVRLAGFLAGRLVSGDAVPSIRLSDYADSLGRSGLDRLRELVSAVCERRPSCRAARDALIDVLTAIGDVDALVEVLAADQDADGRFFERVTAELDMAGRPSDALAWAERGLREAARPGHGLARYVVERYCEQGRAGRAESVLRDWFATDRSAAGYQWLRELAGPAGCWPSVRPWALGVLRAQDRPGTGPGRARRDPAVVDALIDEGDIDGAWREAAGIASERQWLALADLAAPTRPADALAVYRRQIEALRRRRDEAGYQRLARLLESARDCCERLGTVAEFEAYVRAVRDDNRRKRRLIRVLDAHQL